jgi:hypothetical protein
MFSIMQSPLLFLV